MLDAELTYSHQSNNIADVLPIYEAQKLVIAKNNGDIEVFSRSEDTIKLFQTFPGLLKINDGKIQCKELLYAHTLGTIFVRCEKQILLLNSGNLQQYDKITEHRGIANCWIMDDRYYDSYFKAPNDNSDISVLAYSTESPRILRIFVWKNRTFQYMFEKPVTTDKSEMVEDVNRDGHILIITTNKSVYIWHYNSPNTNIIKVEKHLKRKFPDNPVVALADLETLVKHGKQKYENTTSDGRSSILSNKSIVRKQSNYNILSKFTGFKSIDNNKLFNKKFVCVKEANKVTIIDPLKRTIFSLHFNENKIPYLLYTDYSEAFMWPGEQTRFDYIPETNLLLSINQNEITISDNKFGIPFAVITEPDGIKCVKSVNSTRLLVLTNSNALKSYKLTLSEVKTSENESDGDSISVCSSNNSISSFHKLWKQVVFYNHILQNKNLDELLNEISDNDLLNILLLKFRDLTVLFSLQILEKYFKLTDRLELTQISKKTRELINHFERTIISGIFQTLSNFWAPPPLVIAKTLPNSISSLVGTLTGEFHSCMPKFTGPDKNFTIPSELILKYFLPYVIDMRRVIRRFILDKSGSIEWTCFHHKLTVGFNFFLIDNHEDINSDSMLTLIDTVIFEIYYNYNPTMVGSFLRIDNQCSYEIVTQKLKEKKYIQELVDFYYQREKHELALSLLTSMSKEFGNDNNTKELDNVTKILIIQYLQKLDRKWLEVIFSYTDWLIQKFTSSKQEVLSSIFMNDTSYGKSLVSEQVYDFIAKRNRDLSLTYLEFVLTVFNNKEKFVLTELLKRYLDLSVDNTLKIKISSLVKLASSVLPSAILIVLEEKGSEQNKRFILHLKTIPLFELKKHGDSIDILFDKLGDYEASSSYCNRVYKEDPILGRNYFSVLFEKFLKIIDESNIQVLKNFLQENCLKLDIREVISKLPTNLPVSLFEDIIPQLLLSESIKTNDLLLRKNILQIELANNTASMNSIRAEYIKISTNSKCPVCKKNFTGALSEKLLWFEHKGRKILTHYSCKKNILRKNEKLDGRNIVTLQYIQNQQAV